MSVPLVPIDCEPEDLNASVLHSLTALRRSGDEIVDRATRKLAQCRSRLAGYSQRFVRLEQKLDIIEKSDDVPLITSSAEWSGHVHEGRSRVFRTHAERALSPSFRRHTQPSSSNPDVPRRPCSFKEAISRKSGYKFAFPKGKNAETLRAEPSKLFDYDRKRRGLMSVDQFYASLQVANAKDQPTTSDADGGDGFSQSLLIYDRLATLEEADPLAYKPSEGEYSDFDMPEDLPELTGIAKNFRPTRASLFGPYDDDDGGDEMLADTTSLRIDGSLDLSADNVFYVREPPVGSRSLGTQRTSALATPEPSPLVQSSLVSQPLSLPPFNSPLPADVGAPSTSISAAMTITTSTAASLSVGAVPPPPPPPPPPPLLLSPIAAASAATEPTLIVVPPAADGRSDLMAAIRAAGGASHANLKKITTIDELGDAPTPPTSSNAAINGDTDGGAGEDLMASLAKALQKRRQVIAGGKSATKRFDALERRQPAAKSSSTISTLRELIPPPSAVTAVDSDSGESAGGFDDDEWK